jgi:hypothetical protein
METTARRVSDYLAEHGYTVYADYRDEIPAEWIADLLDGKREAFDEKVSDMAFDWLPYVEWDDWRDTIFSALKLPDDLKGDPELDELIREETWIDTTDWLKTAARNTRLNFTATPHMPPPLKPGERLFEEDQDERLFLFPHGNLTNTENERRERQLADVLGITPDEDSAMYEFDELKVLGRLDVMELIEKGPPTHITLSPDMPNTLVTHNAVNGSGGCGEPVITKTATLPAMFEIDQPRYGVDAVFGFVGEVWAQELPAEWR